MKKNQKRREFTDHASIRLKERINNSISIESILKAIKSKELAPIKKLTLTRTLYYGMINNSPIKLIYSNSVKKVITVLPFTYDYSFNFNTILNNYIYSITIFPDCYMETKNPQLLTCFKKHCNDWEHCTKSSINNFKEIFDMAWNGYNQFKREKQHEEICACQEAVKCNKI